MAAAIATVLAGTALVASSADAYVYWGSGSDHIGRANLDGTGDGASRCCFSGAFEPGGVAVDSQHVYWSDPQHQAIGRADLDGSNANANFIPTSSFLSQADGIAVDGGHIYWANTGGNPGGFPPVGSIGRANLDGTGVDQSFIQGAFTAQGVAVDAQHVYWADFYGGEIGRADLDGSNVQTSFVQHTIDGGNHVTAGPIEPDALAVDGQHIYWSDAYFGSIARADIDGTDPGELVPNAGAAAVAVDDEHVFWTSEDDGGPIGRADLDGGNPNYSLIANADAQYGGGVAVDGLASPLLGGDASADITIGGSVSDTVTLSSGQSPTGTITFSLYGPGDASCSGTPASVETATVSGNGAYTSAGFAPTTVGTYNWTAEYSGDLVNAPAAIACGASGSSVSVFKQVTALAAHASAGVTLGGSLSDTATLSSGQSPGGTITFNLYGPGDVNCSQGIISTSSSAVTGNGTFTSAGFTPTAVGTYNWTAAYSGDARNAAASVGCAASGQSTTVSMLQPTLSSTASPDISLGGSVSDSATLTSGQGPSGTITFSLYGPDDADCSEAPAFSESANVTGNGTYNSSDFVPTAAGGYAWTIAYSGDARNAAATSACNAPGQSVAVAKLQPTLSAVASPRVARGGSVTDVATLASGRSPTGTITFRLYGPNDSTCRSSPAFTSRPVTVSGNGTYTSPSYVPLTAGPYRWTATYSGDSGNGSAGVACNAENGSVFVSAVPTLTSVASANVALGGSVTSTATIALGRLATGTIDFSLYGPNDANCSGMPVLTDTVDVSGNAGYTSSSFTPTVVGTYRWTASYSGDPDNAAAASACNAPRGTVTVGPAQLQAVDSVFVQSAGDGTLTPIAGTPASTLHLHNVAPRSVRASSQPTSDLGAIPTPRFMRSWDGFGFDDQPPSAALTLKNGRRGADTVVVRLNRPRYDPDSRTLRYRVRMVPHATGNLAPVEPAVDDSVPQQFGAASLSIDDEVGFVYGGCVFEPYAQCPGLVWPNADLQNSILNNANFSGAALRSARMSGVFDDADFTDADLTGATLGGSFSGADLSGSTLADAQLEGTNLTDADLTGAQLDGANFRPDPSAPPVNFTGADLTGASLTGVNLYRANFTDVNLTNADLTGASQIQTVLLSGAIFCQTTMSTGFVNNRDC